jgi:catechol 2,3-dioxygenase-like lactoylglutathione lyase family enzyme
MSVRYIVDDVDTAVAFYEGRLGFGVEARPGPGFAVVSRGPLRLLLSTPSGVVDELREAGASFRNAIVTGRGGKQILLDDPSGNPIELFEPARD